METRELRYFVAVAEELHFGRAAERLGMAQPPLSRAIGQLERRLGARLLERSPRAVTLTPAGTVLLSEARAALDAVEAAERRTRRAAAAGADQAPVVLATKAGASVELLAKLLDAYAAEPGAAPVDVLLCGPGEQEAMLRDGRADVALLHRPFDSTAGLDVEELGTERQSLFLPAGHPLTGRTDLRLADIADLTGLPSPAGHDATAPVTPPALVQRSATTRSCFSSSPSAAPASSSPSPAASRRTVTWPSYPSSMRRRSPPSSPGRRTAAPPASPGWSARPRGSERRRHGGCAA